MSIYDNIEAIAREKNLTIKAIEDGSGLKQSTIGKWKESVPKVDMLFKVAQFLELPMEYFLTGNRPDQEEYRLVANFRECDRDGKDIVLGHAVEERRRSVEERKKAQSGVSISNAG